MARERMVTRTVELTTAEVICMNVVTVETQIISYEISGTYSTKEDVLKVLKKLHETDEFKVVAVQSFETKEVLYGMTEVEFIKLAKVLPPRGTKAEETEEEIAEIEETEPANNKKSK